MKVSMFKMNKICLKKLFALVLLMFHGFFGISQSKKIQIQSLTHKLDSLQTAHDLALKAYVDSIQTLRNEVKTYVEKVGFLHSEIDKKEFQLKREHHQINDCENKINSLKHEISDLKKKSNTHQKSTLPEFLIGKVFKFECTDEDEKYVLSFTKEVSTINSREKAVFISGYEWGGEIIRTIKSDENLYNVYYLNNTDYEYSEKVQLITFEINEGKILFADHLLTNCPEGSIDASSTIDFEEELEMEEEGEEEFESPIDEFPDVEASFVGEALNG